MTDITQVSASCILSAGGTGDKKVHLTKNSQFWDEQGLLYNTTINDYVWTLIEKAEHTLQVNTYVFTLASTAIRDGNKTMYEIGKNTDNNTYLEPDMVFKNLSESIRKNCKKVVFLVHDAMRTHFLMVEYDRTTKVATLRDSARDVDSVDYTWIYDTVKKVIEFPWPNESQFITFTVDTKCSKQSTKDVKNCGVYTCAFARLAIDNKYRMNKFNPNLYRQTITKVLNYITSTVYEYDNSLVELNDEMKHIIVASPAVPNRRQSTRLRQESIETMDVEKGIATSVKRKLTSRSRSPASKRATPAKISAPRMQSPAPMPVASAPIPVSLSFALPPPEARPYELYQSAFNATTNDRWFDDSLIDCFLSVLTHFNSNAHNISPVFLQHAEHLQGDRIDYHTDLLQFDTVLLPVNHNDTHWTLCVFYPKHNHGEWYDSMPNNDRGKETKVRMNRFWNQLTGNTTMDVINIDYFDTNKPNLTIQEDGHSCGPITCLHAEQILKYQPTKQPFNAAEYRKYIGDTLVNSALVRIKPDPGVIRTQPDNTSVVFVEHKAQPKPTRYVTTVPIARPLPFDKHCMYYVASETIDQLGNELAKNYAGIIYYPVGLYDSLLPLDLPKLGKQKNGIMIIMPILISTTYALLTVNTSARRGSLHYHTETTLNNNMRNRIKSRLQWYNVEATLSLDKTRRLIVPDHMNALYICGVMISMAKHKMNKLTTIDHAKLKELIEDELGTTQQNKDINMECIDHGVFDEMDDEQIQIQNDVRHITEKILTQLCPIAKCNNINNILTNNKTEARQAYRFKQQCGDMFDDILNKSPNVEKLCLPPREKCLCVAPRWLKYEKPTLCCNNGKINKPEHFSYFVPKCMESVKAKILSKDDKNLISEMRNINAFLAFGSTVFPQPAGFVKKRGPPMPLMVQGKVQAGLCTLIKKEGTQPAFAQLYLENDKTVEEAYEATYNKKQSELCKEIHSIIKDNHPYANAYRTMHEVYEEYEAKAKANNEKMPYICMNIVDKRDVPADSKAYKVVKHMHPGTLNKPVAECVAMIYVNPDEQFPKDMSEGVRVYPKFNPKFHNSIVTYRECRDSLLYPVLFPTGSVLFQKGNALLIPKEDQKYSRIQDEENPSDAENNDDTKPAPVKLKGRFNASKCEMFRHAIHVREEGNKHWLQGYGKLTQQYILDVYTQIEADRLSYMRLVQQKMQGYKSISAVAYARHMAQKLAQQGIELGSFIRMRSDYPGSKPWCQRMYYDAMALSDVFGRPSLFITFTGNPQWEEIQNELLENNTWQDQPDLAVRAFHVKMQLFIKLFEEKHIHGKVLFSVGSVEFQKRGMPHLHYLVTLENPLDTVDMIDSIITAQYVVLPADINSPEYSILKQTLDRQVKYMTHGPCEVGDAKNLACRDCGRIPCDMPCLKHYPRPFRQQTTIGANGMPEYARPNNGVFHRFANGKEADNRHVVPHNIPLMNKFDAHINVECCLFADTYRYIFKYVFKGNDKIIMEIRQRFDKAVEDTKKLTTGKSEKDGKIVIKEKDLPGTLEIDKKTGKKVYNHDETEEYLLCRYLSPTECMWRVNGFPLSVSTHTTQPLFVHLPGENAVAYTGTEEDAKKALNTKLSRFLASMELRKNDLRAHGMTFVQIDQEYRWDQKEHKYCEYKRQVNNNISYLCGGILPNRAELYALYQLVRKEVGYMCYDDLKRSKDDSKVFDTFTEAAKDRGYIEDDTEAEKCMAEAAKTAMSNQLRVTFAILLIHCEVNPEQAQKMWNTYKKDMIGKDKTGKKTVDQMEQKALRHIASILKHSFRFLKDFGLPEVTDYDAPIEDLEPEDIQEAEEQAIAARPTLNEEQKSVVDQVLHAIDDESVPNRCFFLQASGGCGKSYLFNYLINECIANRKEVMAIASTGIAATLLKRGRTAHSAFKIPIKLQENEPIRLDNSNNYAAKLRNVKLIIWDEAFMQHKDVINYVNDAMQHVAAEPNKNKPFGGSVVLLGGDWQQILPVVRGDPRKSIMNTITQGKLWQHFTVLRLTTNMRVNTDEQEFRSWLATVGDGTANEPGTDNEMRLPNAMVVQNMQDLFDFVYPLDLLNDKNPDVKGRAILSLKNEQVDKFNADILAKVGGTEHICVGITTVDSEYEESIAHQYPMHNVEQVEKCNPNGYPPHVLKLKVGAPVMLLRNLNIDEGLCNGTRVLVTIIGDRNLYGINLLNGKQVIIPRINLKYEGEINGIVFTRRQFPVKLAFAMTVNKSQGQTLNRVGLLLESPTFAHGQMYVAMSRVRSADSLKVFVNESAAKVNGKDDDGKPIIMTKNVVYPQVGVPLNNT